jgi:hypothetical protein
MMYDLILACVLLVMLFAGFLAGWWLRGAWFPPRAATKEDSADPLAVVHIEVLGQSVQTGMVIGLNELEKLAGALGRYTVPMTTTRH